MTFDRLAKDKTWWILVEDDVVDVSPEDPRKEVERGDPALALTG